MSKNLRTCTCSKKLAGRSVPMALFQFNALRRFIRSHMRPIKEADAATWKKRLSVTYMLLAWNAFGFVMYMVWTGKADWAKAHGLKSEEEIKMTPAQQWSRTLGIKDAQVYRISGFKVSSYEIHNDFDEEQKVDNSTQPQVDTQT